MTRFISRITTAITGIIKPAGPSFLDAAFNGVRSDPASPTADHGAAVRPGSPIDRLRSQRRDIAAALLSDAGQPDQELSVWPPAANHRIEPCRAC
jgi:hypothetical protein